MTFDFRRPQRGMVVTTAALATNPAQSTQTASSKTTTHTQSNCSMARTSGIADEIVPTSTTAASRFSAETLRPYDPAADVDAGVEVAFATSRTSRAPTSRNHIRR